jgi:hypothetical protein
MSTQNRIKWDERTINTASSLWDSGKTVSDLARHFDVSRSTISGMILRNRAKFKARNDESGKPLVERPKSSSGGANKSRNPKWSETQYELAVKLWDEGRSLRYIGAEMGLNASTVHFIASRNPDRFRPRQRTRIAAPTAVRASREPVLGFIETQASERYDFTRYQIANTEPVAYWKLSGCQCHFPLERFEAVSGPETPCCGQRNIEGQSYCNTHWKLMHEVHAR